MTSTLKTPEIHQLELQGCSAADWNSVKISPNVNLKEIRNVRFGNNVTIEDFAVVRDIPGGIFNCTVKKGALIENVGRIGFDDDATCGVGTLASVLDETGSRPSAIYPGLSAQLATLMARVPDFFKKISPSLPEFFESKKLLHVIGESAVVRDCGQILNVFIDRRVVVDGAQTLKNGAIINSAADGSEFAFVGSGVDAENFIIEDGRADSGALLRNCYVGQGAEVNKGFTGHDSLFFANCTFENGETCAVLAGPFSVSMHKASLIISCQLSFFNAGSATNQSNHMYKLGPAHWGVLERGVKTSSGSYLMLGAKIGAFSLVMGQHKNHPDTSAFPFSYLFGDERGNTIVVPAIMLRSCGLVRDQNKWPARDRRKKHGLHPNDRINYSALNPATIDTMLKAINTINQLLVDQNLDGIYLSYKGMKFTYASLEMAKMLYTTAIFKYLSNVLPDGKFPESDEQPAGEWVDLGGQIILRETLNEALTADNIPEVEKILDKAFLDFEEDQLKWVARRFGAWWRKREKLIPEYAAQFDDTINDDRQKYVESVAKETRMLDL